MIANWKMHGSKDSLIKLVQDIGANLQNNIKENFVEFTRDIDCILCPPQIYLQTIIDQRKLSNFFNVGAQNVYCVNAGAFTGEISPAMLKDVGCQYVILGHSERRQLFAENDELIARKFIAAYDAGIIPIVCVGETKEERTQGKALEVVERQLGAILNHASINQLANSLIAYEPVWAIGTGQTATPNDAETMHADIRQWFMKQYTRQALEDIPDINETVNNVRILYGGSIKASNAAQLFEQPNIDGGLVGAASLDAKEFLDICRAAILCRGSF